MQHLTYFDHLKIISTNWGLAFVLFGLGVAIAGAWIIVRLLRDRDKKERTMERVVGAILLVVGGLGWTYLQTLIPMRYAINPTRALYSNAEAAAITRPLYEDHCAICHGETGRGDGELASFMSPPPADFSIHGWHHREGEHYWWITRGIPGTGMPGFSQVLSEEERWLLARYVKQLGREARIP